ncbi:MAG: ImmA/IrrE family metallo-endopeptidase [Ignavibacteriaceae bacterium]|nr:ImmA/IrrE family metallo-endopeptidase [Ignavibacteriaceae bacterium]
MSVIAIAKANIIIQEYGISSPDEIELEVIAFDRGLIIQEKELTGCEGRLVNNKTNGLIIVKKSIRESGKKRFIIAHEIGHFELQKGKNNINLCEESSFINWNKNGPQENEANVFASEMLFPKNIFLEFCKGKYFSKDLIIDLADNFECSLSATALRYADIGNIPIAVIFSQNKQIKWYRCHKDFPFQFVDLRIPVNSFSFALDYYNRKDIPDDPQEIISDAWFTKDFRFKSQHKLFEQNIPFSSYNAVLSLVWEI